MGALVACPSLAGLAFVAPDLIPLALGPQWLPSVPIIQVFALLAAITPLVWLQGALMCGIGRADVQLTMGVVSTAALLAGLALVRPLSLVGFAAVMVARSYLVFPLYLFLMQRTNGINPRASVGTSLRPVLASLLMLSALFGASSLLPEDLHRAARVAVFVIIGSLTYGAAPFKFAKPILGKLSVMIYTTNISHSADADQLLACRNPGTSPKNNLSAGSPSKPECQVQGEMAFGMIHLQFKKQKLDKEWICQKRKYDCMVAEDKEPCWRPECWHPHLP